MDRACEPKLKIDDTRRNDRMEEINRMTRFCEELKREPKRALDPEMCHKIWGKMNEWKMKEIIEVSLDSEAFLEIKREQGRRYSERIPEFQGILLLLMIIVMFSSIRS